MKYTLKHLYASSKRYQRNFGFLLANVGNEYHDFFYKREKELHDEQKEIRKYLKAHGVTYPSGNTVYLDPQIGN